MAEVDQAQVERMATSIKGGWYSIAFNHNLTMVVGACRWLKIVKPGLKTIFPFTLRTNLVIHGPVAPDYTIPMQKLISNPKYRRLLVLTQII